MEEENKPKFDSEAYEKVNSEIKNGTKMHTFAIICCFICEVFIAIICYTEHVFTAVDMLWIGSNVSAIAMTFMLYSRKRAAETQDFDDINVGWKFFSVIRMGLGGYSVYNIFTNFKEVVDEKVVRI